LDFIQSGELAASHATQGKLIVIRIVAQHEPSPRAADFIQFVTKIVNQAGVELEFGHLGSA